MTIYTTSINLTDNSTDPENNTLSISHAGLSDPPGLIDWGATNPKTFTVLTTGTVKVYQDGVVEYDDNNDVTNHPTSGNTSANTLLYFKVSDGALPSSNRAVGTINFLGGAAGDVTAPTLVSMSPAVGSLTIPVNSVFTLTHDETIQQGTGTYTLRNVTLGTDIQSINIVTNAGSGPGQALVTGSTVTLRPTAALPYSTQIAWRWSAGVVKDLAGNNIAANTGNTVTVTTAASVPLTAYPDDPRNWRGKPGTKDFGTTFDYVVDGAGSGTHTTITAAMAAASSGKSIGVKNGVYPEAFTIKSGVTLQAYSTHKPILSAQQSLTGFTQCNISDAGVLGTILGVNGSPIYKKTGILKSSLPVTRFAGMLPMEDFQPLFNAQDRPNQTSIDFQEDESKFHDPVAHGGQYILSGTTVVGVTDTTIINGSRYTNAQLIGKDVAAFGAPNETFFRTITAANTAAGTITFGGFPKDNTNKRRFAIQNVGFAMTPGSFIYVDGGGTTLDLYVYPKNSANIASKMSCSSRSSIISIADNAVDVTIEGLILVGGASTSATAGNGCGITDPSNGNFTNRIKIRYNEFRGFLNNNLSQIHSAALWLVRTNDVLVEYNTFNYCAAHGCWPNGSGVNQSNILIRRNVFYRCGSAGSKAYRQNKYMFVHNYHEWCGYRSHGNLGNVYSGGIDALWFGNEFQFCNGYFSSQNMTNDNYLFNFIPCDNKYSTGASVDRANRKIEAQGANGISYCFNNSAPPTFLGSAQQGNMAIDPSDGGKTSYIANNIAHGIPTPADSQGTIGYAKNNLITNDQYGGSVNGNLDASDFLGGTGKFDTTNVFQPNVALVFTDYANRDWSPVNGSSPMLTTSAYNIEPVINSYFLPTFTTGLVFPMPVGDFYIDCFGNPFSYASLKIGADQSI
jgi:hypothetical protein